MGNNDGSNQGWTEGNLAKCFIFFIFRKAREKFQIKKLPLQNLIKNISIEIPDYISHPTSGSTNNILYKLQFVRIWVDFSYFLLLLSFFAFGSKNSYKKGYNIKKKSKLNFRNFWKPFFGNMENLLKLKLRWLSCLVSTFYLKASCIILYSMTIAPKLFQIFDLLLLVTMFERHWFTNTHIIV